MRFVRTYLIALVAICVVAAAAFAIALAQAYMTTSADFGKPRPTGAQLASYTLTFDGPDASGPVVVDIAGAACNKLKPSDYLVAACTLALNVDPAFIAGDAAGDLNNVDTPASEAIIWRARLESDPALCDRGGLLGARLETCHQAASGTPDHVVSRDGVTVTIEPVPVASPPD